MMLSLITDEIISLTIIAVILFLGWTEFGTKYPILFVVSAFFFTAGYLFLFAILKVFAPNIYLKSGEYERCISYCNVTVNRFYSIVRIFKSGKLITYYEIYRAYTFIKLKNIEEADKIVDRINDENVLKGQTVTIRIVKAFVLVNKYDYKRALELLITISNGTFSPRHVYELFFLISLCYLELDEEKDRALNYSTIAVNFKKHEPDYKLNYAVAVYKLLKDVRKAKEILSEVNEDYDKLSNFSKPRLLFYVWKANDDLGNTQTGLEFKRILNERFPDSPFCGKE